MSVTTSNSRPLGLFVQQEHGHEALLSNAQEILSAMQVLLLNSSQDLTQCLSFFQSSCDEELDMRVKHVFGAKLPLAWRTHFCFFVCGRG